MEFSKENFEIYNKGYKAGIKETLKEVINFMEEELHFVDVVECEKELKKRLNI